MTPWTKLSKEERISEDIEMKLSEYGIAECKGGEIELSSQED